LKRLTLTREWEGLTAVVIGNGFSILGIDFSPVISHPRMRAMVANGGYRTVPAADLLMCSDRHWLKANPDLTGFKGSRIIVTRPEAVAKEDPRMVHMQRAFIEHMRGFDIFKDPGLLVEGHTSTSTNISAAVLLGVKRILLLGIDLTPGPGGKRSTYNSDVDDPSRASVRYARQVQHFTAQSFHVKARGVEVFNCSPRSALACYPYATLGDFL